MKKINIHIGTAYAGGAKITAEIGKEKYLIELKHI
jgi:hypothetical protein